jgi:hypothetical protein
VKKAVDTEYKTHRADRLKLFVVCTHTHTVLSFLSPCGVYISLHSPFLIKSYSLCLFVCTLSACVFARNRRN